MSANSKKQGAVKPQDAPEPVETGARRGLPTAAWVVIAVAALVVGVLCGHFLIDDTRTISLDGRTSLEATELDSVVATYTYDGVTHELTAREVLEGTNGLDSALNDDGTYDVPLAADILSFAQNEIIVAAAEDEGITVSDEDVEEFTYEMFGTSDYETIASYYGLTEDETVAALTDTALMSKLRDAVVTTEEVEMPTAPTEPEDGEEDTATEEYATYVIGLLGDEWDAEGDTWATTDGDYYDTLSGYEISNDSATYAAAEAAYTVAYNLYSNAESERLVEWYAYANSLLSNASIQIGTLQVRTS